MRVIAGRYRRRQLLSLEGDSTRPMLDRVRETLFNVLQTVIPGCEFLDLFAGTGAVGIEAYSRGAKRVTLVENNPQAVKVIRENLRNLGIQEDVAVFEAAAAKAVEHFEANVVFLGPPYHAHAEYHKVLRLLGARPPEYAIAQHARGFELPDEYGQLHKFRRMDIGKTSLSFYSPAGEPAPDEPPAPEEPAASGESPT